MRKLLLLLLLIPLYAHATDTCIKTTSAPNYSVFGDGTPVNCSIDANGNLRTSGSGGGGSTTANQGTAAADSGSWPVHLVFGTTALSLGQGLMAASVPVAIASDQSAIPVIGNVAAGSADAGAPVKIGGKFNNTPPTLSDGQRGDAQLNAGGYLFATAAVVSTPADGATNSAASLMTSNNAARVLQIDSNLFNGTTWDRARSNIDTAALITLTGAGAGTTNSADQTNYNGKGAQVVANITVNSGTVSLVVNVQGKDIASGQYYTICTTTTPITATGVVDLSIYPGAGTPISGNYDCSTPLPRTWRVQTVNGTGVTPSVTATVGASVIN